MKNHRVLILASASPRRHEILQTAGIPHTVRVADADETLPPAISPADAVEMLSARKAAAVLPCAEDGAVVLAADTVVALDGTILGKPRDASDARAMLQSLAGRTHEVYTGITLSDGKTTVTAHERTRVHMRPLTPAEIDGYVATGEGLDKAGAYGIQGRGGVLVSGIEGDYFSVVGLPLCLSAKLLTDHFGWTLFAL